MGRNIVIGDIHGCFDELSELLKLIDLQTDDRVIAVGDLIVKGPKNIEVLDLFINDPRFSSVVGNHDRKLRQSLRGEPVRLSKEQRRTLDELSSSRDRYFDFLRQLPYSIKVDHHLVIHAGVRPGVPLRQQMAVDMTEIRTMGGNPARRRGLPWYLIYRGPRTIIFGHWPAKRPRRARHAIGLDTGCVYGGRLTAYIIESGEFVSVPSQRNYLKRSLMP
jgi:diadenosine tetraphosphatase ApaH/serine/threonine PP2A family protein phosphatase